VGSNDILSILLRAIKILVILVSFNLILKPVSLILVPKYILIGYILLQRDEYVSRNSSIEVLKIIK
jgi:hypothetical protein